MTDTIPVPREELEKIRRVFRELQPFTPQPLPNCSCLSCRERHVIFTLDRLLKKD